MPGGMNSLGVSALPAKSDELLSAYLTVALVWVVANALTLAPSGLYGRLVGTVILFCVLPGALIVSRALALASADRKAPPWPEVLLLGSAVSYLVTTTIVLLLGYVPQPITYAALLGICDVVILAVLYLNYRSRLRLWSPVSLDRSNAGTVALVALVLVVLLAAFVRLGNLGYGEYVGDEIDVVYRARQAILGNQEELFLQRKGPVQIMVTAAFALGTNSFDELPLRLPFALASVLSVATLYLLGASAWNRRVGLLAAAALAIDGVVVGFSRVVQYGGVVLLTLVVIVYCLHRMSTSEEAGLRGRYLSLALILLASALLAHYEAAMVAVPMVMLLFRERKRVFARENLKELAVAVVIVLALLLVFYVPFVLHPHFSETTDAYANDQMGFGEGPFNNVGRFVGTNIFYNSVYYMVLAALLWGLGTFAVLSRALPKRWRAGAYVGVALVAAGTILSLVAPGSLASEGRSWALVCFVPALALTVWFASPNRLEQAMFAWFFTVFIVSTFLVKTQHLHFYTMAPSAALVAALGLDWVITRVTSAPAERCTLGGLGGRRRGVRRAGGLPLPGVRSDQPSVRRGLPRPSKQPVLDAADRVPSRRLLRLSTPVGLESRVAPLPAGRVARDVHEQPEADQAGMGLHARAIEGRRGATLLSLRRIVHPAREQGDVSHRVGRGKIRPDRPDQDRRRAADADLRAEGCGCARARAQLRRRDVRCGLRAGRLAERVPARLSVWAEGIGRGGPAPAIGRTGAGPWPGRAQRLRTGERSELLLRRARACTTLLSPWSATALEQQVGSQSQVTFGILAGVNEEATSQARSCSRAVTERARRARSAT